MNEPKWRIFRADDKPVTSCIFCGVNVGEVNERTGEKAEQNGLSIKIVPLSDIEPIVGPLKELFASNFIGNAT